ncbi:MAG TPA: M48 family metalloprotease [Solirubrobacteraceae bacterium]|nr:M48 family metalloprotease [Solirubrobacteraceae bacterium]
MRRLRRTQGLWPLLLVAASAESAVRLLAPRKPQPAPAGVELDRYFSAEEVRRGAAFARPQLALGLSRSLLELAALAGLVSGSRRRPRGGPRTQVPSPLKRATMPRLRRRRSWPRRLLASPELGGAEVGSALALGMTGLGLPLSVLARRRAMAVGLITQPWRGWAGDLVKQLAIEGVLAGGAGAAVVALTRRYPRGWWLPAAGGSVALGTVFGALAPVVLDPIFNDFDPLPEGQLRADVLELAEAAGVKVGEVYSVDASRRTTGANAYVTGLGPTKRVVLFDTLIDRYSRDEVRVVVAHELAHVRHRDVLRGLGFAAAVAPASALAIQRLSWILSPERGTPAALPALALSAALVTAPAGLIGNRLSRALERRADDYSLTLSGSPEAFVSFERSIALQNVADVKPPRWVSSLLSTHPPTLERIGAAVAYSHRSEAGVPA